jgi:hypothetical protein
MNPIDPDVGQTGDDPRRRGLPRQTITAVLLIMLAIMIVLDVFIYRRGTAAHPSPT